MSCKNCMIMSSSSSPKNSGAIETQSIYRSCCEMLQVQQVSGAYIMSARNHAERGRPSLSHEESILIPGPEETAEDALWSEDLDSTLENDEEYVVEANAHRSVHLSCPSQDHK